MIFTYEIKRHSVDFLFEDGSFHSIVVGQGPGYWYRIISKLRELGKEINPEDFDQGIERLYYDYATEELRGKTEKQKELGYFTCPQCNVIYPCRSFKYQNPCDNCRYVKIT